MENKKSQFSLQKAHQIKCEGFKGPLKLMHDGKNFLANFGNHLDKIDTETGQIIDTLFTLDFNTINQYKFFSPDGVGIRDFFISENEKLLSMAFERNGFGVLNLDTQKYWFCENRMKDRKVYDIAFNPDSRSLAVSFNEEITIYSADEGLIIDTIPTSFYAYMLFHPSGKILTYTDGDGFSVLDLSIMRLLWQKEVFGSSASYLHWEFNKNGDQIAIGDDGYLNIIELNQDKPTRSLQIQEHDCIIGVYFSNDGKKVFTFSLYGTISAVDIETMKILYSTKSPIYPIMSLVTTDDFLTGISFSTDYSPNKNTFTLWDLSTGEIIENISMDFHVSDYKLVKNQLGLNSLIIVGNDDFITKLKEPNKKSQVFQICSILL